MEELNKLLGRVKQSLDRDVNDREIVALCIREIFGFDVRLEDISIKNDTLRIQTSPVKRNEIKLKEDALLEKVSQRTKLKLKNVAY